MFDVMTRAQLRPTEPTNDKEPTTSYSETLEQSSKVTSIPPATQELPSSSHPAMPLPPLVPWVTTIPTVEIPVRRTPTCVTNDELGSTITRSGREVKGPTRYGEWGHMALSNVDQPSLQEALVGDEAQRWHEAMQDELAQLRRYETWEEVDAPTSAQYIDTKWVLRRKRDKHGKIVKYKAWLTARGFSQIQGLDFERFRTIQG